MTNLLLALTLAPAAASAGELELSAHAGAVFPFYSETFEFDPGGLPGLPFGTTVEQVNPFRLDAHGGVALGLSASWQFSEWFGLEARLDTADVTVRMTGARYDIVTPLPGPRPRPCPGPPLPGPCAPPGCGCGCSGGGVWPGGGVCPAGGCGGGV